MSLYSLLAKKEYTDDSGELRKLWYKAGFVKETDAGGRYLTMYHQPETMFIIVPHQDQEPVIEAGD